MPEDRTVEFSAEFQYPMLPKFPLSLILNNKFVKGDNKNTKLRALKFLPHPAQILFGPTE